MAAATVLIIAKLLNGDLIQVDLAQPTVRNFKQSASAMTGQHIHAMKLLDDDGTELANDAVLTDDKMYLLTLVREQDMTIPITAKLLNGDLIQVNVGNPASVKKFKAGASDIIEQSIYAMKLLDEDGSELNNNVRLTEDKLYLLMLVTPEEAQMKERFAKLRAHYISYVSGFGEEKNAYAEHVFHILDNCNERNIVNLRPETMRLIERFERKMENTHRQHMQEIEESYVDEPCNCIKEYIQKEFDRYEALVMEEEERLGHVNPELEAIYLKFDELLTELKNNERDSTRGW